MKYTVEYRSCEAVFGYDHNIVHFEADTDKEAIFKIAGNLTLDFDIDKIVQANSDRDADGEEPLSIDEILDHWTDISYGDEFISIKNDSEDYYILEPMNNNSVCERTEDW